MVLLFGGAFVYAILSVSLSLCAFWRSISKPGADTTRSTGLKKAAKDAATLHYLGGGGAGCHNEHERSQDSRRLFHHLTSYGFLLCFTATCIATLYHYLLGYEAPYPWYDLPVLLGSLGGMGLLIGPVGLLRAKLKRNSSLSDASNRGMDVAFLAMLFLSALTGLLLLVLRATPAMALLLAVHLGVVFSLFITIPYGKFVHAAYRFAALVKYAAERSTESH